MLRTAHPLLPLTLLASVGGAQSRFLECTDAIHTLLGQSAGDTFGWVSTALPDVTGDGVQELLTSAPFLDAAFGNVGRIYVYDPVSGALLFRADGLTPGELLGTSVAPAGDVNGDGFEDYVAGAPGGGTQAGLARVYSGLDGSLLRTMSPGVIGDGAGSTVAGVGDVNGDGFDDVALGAPRDDSAGNNAGRVIVFSGADGTSVLATIDGEAAGNRFGSGMGCLGDVTGDGRPELAVGAQNGGPGARGRSYVFDLQTGTLLYQNDPDPLGVNYGQFFVYAVGDVNADGWPDLYVSDFSHNNGRGRAYVYDGPSGARLHTISGLPSAGFGIGRGAGDVDGDGHDDLLMGSWTESSGASQGGRAQVFSGKDGTLLRTITSTRAGENLGFDAHGIGDVDGDGRPDYVLTAANRGNSRGAVYVVAGGAPLTSFGTGLAGTGGIVPALSFTGCPQLGSAIGASLTSVRGGAPGCLVFGPERAPMPYRGGTLYTDPAGAGAIRVPHVASGVPGMAGAGAASFAWTLPPDATLRGSVFVGQAAYVDPDASAGISLTAAIRLELY